MPSLPMSVGLSISVWQVQQQPDMTRLTQPVSQSSQSDFLEIQFLGQETQVPTPVQPSQICLLSCPPPRQKVSSKWGIIFLLNVVIDYVFKERKMYAKVKNINKTAIFTRKYFHGSQFKKSKAVIEIDHEITTNVKGHIGNFTVPGSVHFLYLFFDGRRYIQISLMHLLRSYLRAMYAPLSQGILGIQVYTYERTLPFVQEMLGDRTQRINLCP